jgi:G3E family GTPase
MRFPVTLLTGFLGSGKTTLLNAALRAPGMENTAVVVNELGEIGLDHLIVARASDNVVLLDAGCLCCTLSDSLQETLADLAFRRARKDVPPFERVVIETSGVADPAPLLNVLLGHPLVTGQYALVAAICTIDAQHFLASRAKYPELDKQAAVADRIVVTKADAVGQDALAPVFSLLKDLNPEAKLYSSSVDSPAFSVFFDLEKRDLKKTIKAKSRISSLGPLQPHGRGTSIRAYSFRPQGPVTWAGWAAWSRLVAAEFGERLIRVKGLLRMEENGEIALVQGVQGVFHRPQRFRDWPDADHGNRLVCIARDLGEADIRATLPALNTAPGTQAQYSLKELKQLQEQQEKQTQQ